MDPVSLAASIAGLITLAGSTLSLTSTYIREAKHGQEIIEEFLQELEVLQFNLTRLDEFLRSETEAIGYFDNTSVLVSSTHSCRLKLTALHDKLVECSRERRLSLHTFGWPLKVKEHRQMIGELKAFTHWIQFALTINGCTLLAKTSGDVLDVLRKQVESLQLLQKVDDQTQLIGKSQREQSQACERSLASEKRRKTLDWISIQKYSQTHNDICKPRVQGTGDWLLRERDFLRWESVLWCQGIQGSGKTILASRVIDYIKDEYRNQSACLAYFYFNYQNGRTQTPEMVLASLLRQIADSIPDLPIHLSELHQRVESQQRQLQQQDLEQAILLTSAEFEQTFVVIDALDECDTEYRQDFLRSLAVLQKSSSMKILLTSRPHVGQEITTKLGKPIQIEVGASDTDLRRFITSKIDNSDNLDVIDEDFKEEIIGKVINAAHRMFLLAALQIRTVLNQPSAGDMDMALERLPRDLDHAFTQTLERIKAQPEGQHTLGMSTLMWIAYARRPLLVTELSEALAIKPKSTSLRPRFRPSQKRMVDCCMGLVAVDETSSIIRLVHFSVQEYLQKYQGGLFANGERVLAEACITYLIFDPFALGPRSTEAELEVVISNNTFAKYATHHWGSHVRAAGDSNINQLALNFLEAAPQRGYSHQILHYTAELREEYWSKEESESCNGLHVAATFGLVELGKCLLDAHKARVDDVTRMGTTALIKAAAGGHTHFTHMLLGMKANLMRENWYGTALHCAAEAGQVATISILLDTGLNVDVRDQRGRTSLHCATVSGRRAAMQALLKYGANVNAICDKNYTSLRYAVVWEHPPEIVQILLAHGADTEIQSSRKVTPLHDAAVMDSIETAAMLLDYGADVQAQDSHGGTPLHFAAEKNNAAMVLHLLDHGAQIDIKTHEGVTALYLAAGNGAQETVKVLLQHGADTELGDEDGITPIDVALTEHHGTIVQTLVAAGAKTPRDTKSAVQNEVNSEYDAASVELQPMNTTLYYQDPYKQDSEDQVIRPRRSLGRCEVCLASKRRYIRSPCTNCRVQGSKSRNAISNPSRPSNLDAANKIRAIGRLPGVFKVLREESERIQDLKTREPESCSVFQDIELQYLLPEFPEGVKLQIPDQNKAHTSPDCQFKSTDEDIMKQHMERVHGYVHNKANPLNDLYTSEVMDLSLSPVSSEEEDGLGSIAHLLGDLKVGRKDNKD